MKDKKLTDTDVSNNFQENPGYTDKFLADIRGATITKPDGTKTVFDANGNATTVLTDKIKGQKQRFIKGPDQELISALARIGREFRSNELAYLATTMKVEGPLRDRLAFLLHQDYQPAGLVVAREWNRIDLAVLDENGTPLILVELKAMYTFDAFSNLKLFTDATSADELKAQRLAEPGTAVYSLLLVTHLSGSIPARFMKPVKYARDINKAVARHSDAASVLVKASDAIEKNLSNRAVVDRGPINGGSAFDLNVSVHYWLVRNDLILSPN